MIRELRGEDIPGVIRLGHMMHQESAYRDLPFSGAKVAALCGAVMADRDQCCFIYHRDRPVGVVAGYITQYWFGEGRIAQDYVWYVEPEYRGSSAAVRLMKAWLDWCDARNVDEVCNGISTEIDTERTGGMLDKLGFRQIGRIYKRAS